MPMSERYHVQADWDAEAGVWISSSNIPGLVVEAETLAEFVELAQALAPELLMDNLGLHGPTSIEFRAVDMLDPVK